jgi:type II secretory pathway pseudopilin PulG
MNNKNFTSIDKNKLEFFSVIRGFTIIELVVSMTISIILMVSISVFVSS